MNRVIRICYTITMNILEFYNISYDDPWELIFAYAADFAKGSTVDGYVSSYNSSIDCEHCPFFFFISYVI